jgi:single-strand DNA-binding protein
MYALNKAQIIGHLTEDPQIRQTPSGQTVGDLNIVTKQTFTNVSGQLQQGTSYHSVVVWRGLADICGRFLKKGSQVYISGRIQTDEWEDQNTGQKRYKTRITADELILLDPKNPNPSLPADAKVAGGLNQAQVLGNVTRDPELRQTPNGDSVVSFGIATNFAWKDRSGQDQEKTEFHNIVAWGALAKSIAENVKKGRKMYIAGRLQTRSWETPDGQKRYATEVIADSALALGIPDENIGAPSISTGVRLSEPAVKRGVVPENPVEVPQVNYESEIKPEDLPF